MSRNLLIMRHAKSAWDTDAATDFERPLAKRGQKDAPSMGGWLREKELVPDYLVSSPAERARQTAISVSKALDFKKKKINWDARIYGAGTEELLEVLAEAPKETKTVLIVGHNPGLEFLFAHLSGDSGGLGYESGLIKTATVVHLQMPDNWDNLAKGCATLVTVQSPRELPL